MRADGDRCFATVVIAESHRGGLSLLRTEGVHAVLVHRAVARAVLFTCPCGCNEVLTVNLDPRAGDAWRCRSDDEGLTLFPSIRRTSGCSSHFIVWRGRLWWCSDADEPLAESATWPTELRQAVRRPR